MAKCTICSNAGLRKVIDGNLNEGMTGVGVSRAMDGIGVSVTPEVVNRHKQHYKPEQEREKGTRKRDFAIMVRDTYADLMEEGKLDPLNKEHAPGISAGLKAQSLLDGREKQKSKQANAELAFAIIQMLQGGAQPLLLDDGNTIEGEYEVVDGED